MNRKDLKEFFRGAGSDWESALRAHIGGDGVLLYVDLLAREDFAGLGVESQFMAGGGVGGGAESI